MKVKFITLAALISSSLVLSTQAANIVSANESITTQLCVTALAGNRAAMHNKIIASGYSSRFVANKVQCNGENLVSYIKHFGKNSASMVKMLDNDNTNVSIIDIAKNDLVQ